MNLDILYTSKSLHSFGAIAAVQYAGESWHETPFKDFIDKHLDINNPEVFHVTPEGLLVFKPFVEPEVTFLIKPGQWLTFENGRLGVMEDKFFKEYYLKVADIAVGPTDEELLAKIPSAASRIHAVDNPIRVGVTDVEAFIEELVDQGKLSDATHGYLLNLPHLESEEVTAQIVNVTRNMSACTELCIKAPDCQDAWTPIGLGGAGGAGGDVTAFPPINEKMFDALSSAASTLTEDVAQFALLMQTTEQELNLTYDHETLLKALADTLMNVHDEDVHIKVATIAMALHQTGKFGVSELLAAHSHEVQQVDGKGTEQADFSPDLGNDDIEGSSRGQ